MNDACDVDVLQELPDAVARQHYELVVLSQLQLAHLRDRVHSHSGGHLVAEGAGHGEAWDVLGLQPDSEGTQGVPVLVSVRIDSAVVGQDHFRFVGVVGFVIVGEGVSGDLVASYQASRDDSSGVTNIRYENLPSIGQQTHTC